MAHKTRKMCTAQSVIISHTAWLTHTCIQTHLLPVRAFKDAAATNSQPGFCVAARRPNYNLYSFTDRKQASTPVSAHTPNLVIGSRRERHDSDKSSIWSVCCGAVEKNCTIYAVSRTGSGKGNCFQFANQLLVNASTGTLLRQLRHQLQCVEAIDACSKEIDVKQSREYIVTAVGTADAVWRMHDSCRCIVLQQKLGDPYNVMQSWAAREL